MAAQKRRTTATGARKSRRGTRAARTRALDAMQQIWLAGMGAISRAQSEGPAAFQEAVADGIKLLGRSRENAEKLVREALDSAQGSMQGRIRTARGQARETLDNLESLFQTRVRKALQQIGVPTAGEVRALTRRVSELNDSVRQLTAKRPGRGAGRASPGGPRSRRKSGARARAKRAA